MSDASGQIDSQAQTEKVTHEMLLKMNAMPEEPSIDQNHVSVVLPFHGQYLQLENKEHKYPILNPYILQQVYSKQAASQRTLLKGVKMDRRAVRIATIVLEDGHSADIFEQRLPHKRRDTASII